ncbi:hypothetical protein OG213_57960 (plasmid) [Streptomyces mirabilis]|nr:hypothetical protein [Streptomyces mirabilis]MCX4428797.1 hypothetical protein [Streptomyces mirabilis]
MDAASRDIQFEIIQNLRERIREARANGWQELAALAAEKTREGDGLRLMGEGGLLPEIAQHLMQSALETEMDLHLAEEASRAGGGAGAA